MRRFHFEHFAILFARVSLALIFIWFGILKLTGVSPVAGVIAEAVPMIGKTPILYTMLGWFEVVLGVGILIPRLTAITGWLIAAHLTFATASVLISPQSFNGGFPVLSVVGEFVVKNLALISVALLLIIWPRQKAKT